MSLTIPHGLEGVVPVLGRKVMGRVFLSFAKGESMYCVCTACTFVAGTHVVLLSHPHDK